jgi:hypothetical protein
LLVIGPPTANASILVQALSCSADLPLSVSSQSARRGHRDRRPESVSFRPLPLRVCDSGRPDSADRAADRQRVHTRPSVVVQCRPAAFGIIAARLRPTICEARVSGSDGQNVGAQEAETARALGRLAGMDVILYSIRSRSAGSGDSRTRLTGAWQANRRPAEGCSCQNVGAQEAETARALGRLAGMDVCIGGRGNAG